MNCFFTGVFSPILIPGGDTPANHAPLFSWPISVNLSVAERTKGPAVRPYCFTEHEPGPTEKAWDVHGDSDMIAKSFLTHGVISI